MATFDSPSIVFDSAIDHDKEITYHELLGRGGSGEVYRVTFRGNDAAAKKILRVQESSTEEQLEKQIHFLKALKHPNIIKYYGYVVTPTHDVIITEYAAKGSLYDYLKTQTQLPVELKKRWRIQSALGIRYLQEHGVLHRNIKSPNLLITAEDDLKITDFGIVKDPTSTKSGSGSVRWTAPEMLTESKLSPKVPAKADIFALGIVIWELESCEVPYQDFQRREHIKRAIGKDVRPEIRITCPPALRDLIQRCWDKDGNKRPNIHIVIPRLYDIAMFEKN
ncbi:uncharacterized protein [Amphiura filiformis]|uniref:uncharacterized protein n=1 Tax=Amphiura filiformis TaxID=82378 RepID=UPI003B224B3F